ncbi:hypothetical protein [Qipengyuania sp. MTN3-11]|uniref:hypothetical protein n=1 Tax=Qipengyuania sp. MTN3-11 TaxID=3056557 RepID=UPI0036F3CA80
MARLSRIAVAAGIAALGLFAGSQSFAFAIADRQPDLALQIDSNQPQALANIAYNAFSMGQTGNGDEITQARLNEAIMGDPMQVRAFAAMALLRQVEDQEAARLLMSYAQSLSRRNLGVQLWWIEDWAARGDVARTLEHYDIAMRSEASAPGLLFPILVTASSDPRIASELARILADNPVWGEQLVQQIAQSSTDLPGVTELFVAMNENGARVPDAALSAATARMAQAGSLAEAWRAFRAARPQQATRPVRNSAFASDGAIPTVFDWQPQEGSPTATLGNGTLYLSAAAGVSGVAVRQIGTLPPGTWRIDFRHDASDPGNLPRLTASCSLDGTVLGQSRTVGEGLARLTFTVPSSCPFQDLSFALPTSDRPGGASASVRELTIRQEPT